MRRTMRYSILCLIGFLPACSTVPEQKKLGYEPDKWADILSKNGLNEFNSLGTLDTLLYKADSIRALRFLDSIAWI